MDACARVIIIIACVKQECSVQLHLFLDYSVIISPHLAGSSLATKFHYGQFTE